MTEIDDDIDEDDQHENEDIARVDLALFFIRERLAILEKTRELLVLLHDKNYVTKDTLDSVAGFLEE